MSLSVNKLSEADIIRLLPVNDLLYTRTSPMSPIASRTQKKSFAENSAGVFSSGSHAIVNLQSGTDFIDPRQSFVHFKVLVKANASVLLGGGALNLIRESQVKARAGLELDRSEKHNLLQYHLLRTHEKNYVDNNANGLYLASSTTRTTDAGGNPLNYTNARARNPQFAPDVNQEVMIPLCDVFPIFDTDKLCPPHLCRGARLDCTLESLAQAFYTVDGQADATSYEVTDWYILHDSYRMADDVLAFINEQFASKESGLVYEYMSWHNTPSSINAGKINVEVREAVSMATDAFCLTRYTDRQNKLAFDGFASAVIAPEDKSRWRIGSHYLPDTSIEGEAQHWAQYLYWANKLRGKNEVATDYKDFIGDEAKATPNRPNVGMGMFPAVLQRNNILELSGIAINNSSTLSVDASVVVGSAANNLDKREVDVFMRSLRRAVLFLESVQLEK